MKKSTVSLLNQKAYIQVPELMLCDFETGAEGFIASENVDDINIIDTSPSAPTPISGSYMMEIDSSYITGQNWRTVSKTLADSIDVSRIPFFIGYFASYGIDDLILEIRIAFYDVDNNVFSKVIEITENEWNKVKINLSGWPYNTALKRIEISFRSPSYSPPWHSKHQVDALGFTSFYDWTFDNDGDFEGWVAQNDLTADVTGGQLITTITGLDPFIANHSNTFDSNRVKYMKLRVKNETAGTMGGVYRATNLSGWDSAKSIPFPTTSNDIEFKDYFFDLNSITTWSDIIQDLRIDIPDDNSSIGANVIYDSISVCTRPNPVVGDITVIEATDTSIIVKGNISCDDAKTLFLVGLYPYENFNPNSYTSLSTFDYSGSNTSFSFQVDRFDGLRDRIYLKYVVVADSIPLGFPQYVTVYPEAVNKYPYPEVPSIKGLQVQLLDDANMLGVNHAGLNCTLSEILYKDAFVQPDNIIPYEFEGDTYYFNKGAILSLDSQIKALSDDKVNVALILFYMGPLISPDYPYQIVRHPDYIDGAGAAINTTDYAGVQYWKGICEFLASRYTREDQMYGRVLNYIIGNEVCAAGVWNDMGYKQINEYVDQYCRTLRIAYTAIKKYHSAARVHISLDHHWDSSYLPEEPLRSYTGKETTDFFNSQLALQGNIDWSMAFHPYSSDLNDPYIWNDPVPTNDFHTPKITFKNLNIMPEYLSQNHFLFEGQLRRINLTEQGFNTIDPYNLNDQMVQAAAYCYAYYKARFTSGINSFIYHRHVDFTGEMIWVGLWNNVAGSYMPNEPNQKKYVYDVFQKIDTKDSLQITAFALPIIGVNNWDEVIPNFNPNVLEEMPTPQEAVIINVNDITPITFLSDFEVDFDGWYAGENSKGIKRVDAFLNAPTTPYQGLYALENDFKVMVDSGGARASIGITKVFEIPIDVSSTPLLQFAIDSYSADAIGANNYFAKVIVYSGYQKLIGTGTISPNAWNAMSMDLSNWEFKNKIDKIKIWFSTDSSSEWMAAYQVDYIGFAKI